MRITWLTTVAPAAVLLAAGVASAQTNAQAQIAAPASRVAPTPAAAGTATPPLAPEGTNPSALPSATAASTVGEVIVTAQRRSESLQKTPIAVTAISAAALERLNVSTTQDLMQVTPSLQVSTQTAGNGGGSATFFLRGLGQQRAGNGSEPAVGVYVDDFYYPSLQGQIFNILDVQQVEVLRGPQGTLFGRNTIGGAIRYETQKPTDTFGGYVIATGGSYDRRDIVGGVNIPLTDWAALRLTGGFLETDGYVKQVGSGKDDGGTIDELARAQLRLKPTSKLVIDFDLQYSRSYLDGFTYDQPGPVVNAPGTLPFVFNTIPPLGGRTPYNTASAASQCFYCHAATNQQEFSNTRIVQATSVIDYALTDNISLKSLTGYFRVDNTSYDDTDGSPLPIFEDNAKDNSHSISQEFQFNGRFFADRLNLVSGLFYYNDVEGGATDQTVLAAAQPPAEDQRTTTSYAGYFDGTYHLTGQLSLIGGFRYSDDQKTALDIVLSNDSTRASNSGSFSSETGRAGVQYQWTSDIMTYATFSSGFRGGGFNLVNAGTTYTYEKFQPEDLYSYEVGARMAFFDRMVHLNPTVFYTTYDNVQVQSAVPSPQGVLITLQNAASAHSYGAELEGDAKLTPNLSLFGNLALLNIQYDSIGTATGITVHSKFERAPKVTYSIGASYKQPLQQDADLVGTIHWSWEDQQYSTPTDVDRLLLPSYGILNARLDWTLPGRKIDIALFGTNLTDEKYFVGGVNYAANVGTAHYDVGRPREWGVSAHYKF
jgi:iron complex outermembrane receptor protein